MNDCQLQFASAFFDDTNDVLPTDMPNQQTWPAAADLAEVTDMEVMEGLDDEEDTPPGDIEEDDLPLDKLVLCKASATEVVLQPAES